MRNKFIRWIQSAHYPSYVIFFVTARCNATCPMCFYKQNMDSNVSKDELSVEEYEKIGQKIKFINVLGISGGEPFLRTDLKDIVKVLYRQCSPLVMDLPTNGFLSQQIISQVENIVRSCPQMAVDLQLSIDGPEKVHDEIRGLKDGFKRMKETYQGLVTLRKHYRNLRVKGCVVYSHYNQDHMEELFHVLDTDFKELDRIVFSVVHGSVHNTEAWDFDWGKYFSFCDRFRQNARVQSVTDVHSLFTVALRIVKNDFLKKILHSKDMYRYCHAGRRVIVVNEVGQVFPCEPLWEPIADLRKNGYDLGKVLNSDEMKAFQRKIKETQCHCHWGLPMSNTILFSPRYYPRMIWEMARIAQRSFRK